MLSQSDLESMISTMTRPGISRVSLRDKAETIRAALNPHPAGQRSENVPTLQDQDVLGTQHKYRETILFFPTEVRMPPRNCMRSLLAYRANSVILSAPTASAGLSLLQSDQTNSSSPRKLTTSNVILVNTKV